MGEKWQQMKAVYLRFRFWARRLFAMLAVLLSAALLVYSTMTSESIVMLIDNLGWGVLWTILITVCGLLVWNEPYPGSSNGSADGDDDGDDPEDPDDDPLPVGVRPRCRYRDLRITHPNLN